MPIFAINLVVLIVLLNCLKALFKLSAKKKREQERLALRQANSKSSGKRQSKDEELPDLAPVVASASPEVELTVTAIVEPASPPVDPAPDWSKPVIDEAVLSTPAYIRKAGLTPYAAYRRLNPLKTPVVLLSKVREPSSDSMPVFDLGERLLVGFDGVPVH